MWILAPLGAMLVLRIFGGDGWYDFGLQPNFRDNGFWWLASIFIFPVVITISVLPAWITHTLGNVIGNTLLLSGLIQLRPGKELWFSPGVESVSSIVLMFAVGYWLHQRRKNRQLPQQS